MKSLSRILSAAGLAMGLALTAVPADAQQKNAPPPPAATPLKPASPAALAPSSPASFDTPYGLIGPVASPGA
jgi:hypothetical protein